MRSGYIVEDILHSGRKDLRYKECVDEKYDGLKGFEIVFDTAKIKQGKILHWIVTNSPVYEWWDTTMVIAAAWISNRLMIETVNTIYILSEKSKVGEHTKDEKELVMLL